MRPRRTAQFMTLIFIYFTLLVSIWYLYNYWIKEVIPSREVRPPVGDAVRATSEK
jgi:hypothetical protein